MGALFADGALHHTHRGEYMEAMLDGVGGAAGVDLVVADHGFAGAAIEAGITTLSIADVNAGRSCRSPCPDKGGSGGYEGDRTASPAAIDSPGPPPAPAAPSPWLSGSTSSSTGAGCSGSSPPGVGSSIPRTTSPDE